MAGRMSLNSRHLWRTLVSAFLPMFALASRNFTIINGQIFTPGLAIVDAPQPFTPLGGQFLHVAIDVSGNGKLATPAYQADSNGVVLGEGRSLNVGTYYHSVNIFFSSYANGHNLTIANNTIPPREHRTSYVPPVLSLELGSTVKHVNWIWPACLMKGMGEYNISIHQSFTYNSTDYYTIFDLPVMLVNDLDPDRNATDCRLISNPLVIRPQGAFYGLPFQPWVNGTGAETIFEDPDSGADDDIPDNVNDGNSGDEDRDPFDLPVDSAGAVIFGMKRLITGFAIAAGVFAAYL